MRMIRDAEKGLCRPLTGARIETTPLHGFATEGTGRPLTGARIETACFNTKHLIHTVAPAGG